MRPVSNLARGFRWLAICGASVLMLGLSTGVDCDSDAQTAFRQEAASEIGSGIKTIFNGIVDGAVAAVENAGDGSSTSTN